MIDVSNISIKILGNEVSSSLKNFHCEDVNLTIFLRRKARKHQEELLAITYLLFLRDKIIGYFSLSSDTMPVTEIEKDRFVKGKRYNSYPAIKIGRLAIAKEYANEGYGSWLLSAIKYKFANEIQPIGCRYLLVDAYKSALKFYVNNDFIPWTSEVDEGTETCLMYYDLMKSKL